MKCFFAVLCVCTLAINAHNEPGPTQGASESETQNEDFHTPMMEALRFCLKPDGITNVTGIANHVCTNLSNTLDCFAVEENKWNQTHTPLLNKVFASFRRVTERLLTRLCADGAEMLSDMERLWREMSATEHSRQDTGAFSMDCLYGNGALLVLVQQSSVDVYSKVWYYHQYISSLRYCIGRTLSALSPRFVFLAGEQVDLILHDLRCLDPNTQDMIPCSQIDTTGINKEEICPRKFGYLRRTPIDFLVERHVGTCFGQALRPLKATTALNLTHCRNFFREYCGNSGRYINCQREIEIMSETCLRPLDLAVMRLIQTNTKVLYDTTCVREGYYLATIIHTYADVVTNHPEKTKRPEQCAIRILESVQATWDMQLLYQRLSELKQCLLTDVPADEKYNIALNEMQLGLQNNMKCVDGNRQVLCHSINKVNNL